MPTTPRARSRVSLLLTAMIVAACDRGGDEASERNARAARVDVEATIADECPEEAVPAGMERLSLRAADGTPIGAAKLGSGSTAVVLVHGSGQDLCDWLPFATRVADLGVTVVPYDLRGRGASGGSKTETDPLPGDLASVVDTLREDGADRVVLAGTSLGAATALAASGRISPPVDGVVAVSPPLFLGGIDVIAEAGRYNAPIFPVVAAGDDVFARNVEELAAALPNVRPATVLDGSQHGMRLVQDFPDDTVGAIRRAVQEAEGS
ncbi:MAG: alpha/beta hydrolase [Acidimicrobiales bacterium]